MCQNVLLEVIGNSLHHTGFSGISFDGILIERQLTMAYNI